MRADNLERDNRTGSVMDGVLFSFENKNVLLYYFVFLCRTLRGLKGEGNTVDEKQVISLTFNNRTEGRRLPF